MAVQMSKRLECRRLAARAKTGSEISNMQYYLASRECCMGACVVFTWSLVGVNQSKRDGIDSLRAA
eukprot:2661024-Pleurochrysis_carterae.AAC.4